jgi:uncharacterized membrane protein
MVTQVIAPVDPRGGPCKAMQGVPLVVLTRISGIRRAVLADGAFATRCSSHESGMAFAAQKEVVVTSTDRTHARSRSVAALVAAGVAATLALASAGPAWPQAPPSPSPAETCTPGQMVDFCIEIPRTRQAFLLDKGAFTTFAFPGAVLTTIFRINNRGQMVGTYVDAGGATPGGFTHGFLLEDGVFTTIDVPGSSGPLETEILGINNRGQMVGTYRDAEDVIHGFLLDDGVFTTIDHPDAIRETVLFGINSRGQILGGYVDAGGTRRSFLLQRGVFTDFAVPGASRTAGFDLNDRGQVVGFYVDAVGPGHGFLLDRGRFTTIDIPDESGPRPTQILGINNRGQMVGAYITAEGFIQNFLMDKNGVVTSIDHPDAVMIPGLSGTALLGIDERGRIVGAFLAE